MYNALVSVIIPTKNSSRTIEKCLQSIVNQTFKNIEILIIDNFSTDNTLEITSKMKATVYSLEGHTPSAKNFGISKSHGEYLVFIDSDMVLDHKVIEECVRVCSNDNEVVGIIIPERTVGSGFWVKVRDFERSFYVGTAIESARFFVKKHVIQVGGFDEAIVGYEEATLPQRLQDNGYNVRGRVSCLILHNEEGFSLLKRLRTTRYYSGTSKIYSTRYRKFSTRQMGVINRLRLFINKGNWKVLIKHPILSAGMFTLKGLEFLSSFRL